MNRRKRMTNTDTNNTNDPQKKYRIGMVSKTILLEGLNLWKPLIPGAGQFGPHGLDWQKLCRDHCILLQTK